MWRWKAASGMLWASLDVKTPQTELEFWYVDLTILGWYLCEKRFGGVYQNASAN
jgi:hypothetical protein